MADNIKRQKSYPACGRLIVLQSLGNNNIQDVLNAQENFQGFTAINFPSMPEAIELVRRADYMVSSPYGFPDGIHMYKGTQPLRIPVSFVLHSFDSEYCPEGAKTVLEIAATLHSLTLPFGPTNAVSTWDTSANAPGSPTPGDQGSLRNNAQEPTVNAHLPSQNIFPPPTCYLELILTDRKSVGIACVGYVEEAKVRLSAPFLKGPGISQNLPIGGQFDFIFVHHPGHGNAFNLAVVGGAGVEQQAYAQIVKDRLYNTVGLLTNPNNFVSFNDTPTTAATDARPKTFGSGQTSMVDGFLVEDTGPANP